MKILFVCTGNTCRSPMAEALLRHKHPELEVKSAGIFAGSNNLANENAIQVLKEINISLNHRTQPVTTQTLQWADIVLTMTTQHKQVLIKEFPDFQDKYYTLVEYVSEADKEVWEELKKAYADVEEKRTILSQKYKMAMNRDGYNKQLEKYLQEDLDYIRSLESNIINYDISDPFGGDIQVYRQTLQELDKHIDLLIQKIEA